MHVHFVGIAGIGMSGIARVLVEMGHEVSGSDLCETSLTKKLEERGVRFHLGHAKEHVRGAEIVVVSSAIPPENPEVVEAKEKNIPVWQRAEMLGYLMKSKYGIAVAGTHGKTTTTSMLAAILERAGKDPTVVIGGELTEHGINAKLGKSDFLVAEADESDASFLKLFPKIAVVTNIDADVNPSAGPFAILHFDYEKTMERIEQIFLEFLQGIPKDGYAVLCWDCQKLRRLVDVLPCPVLTYGIEREADLVATDVELEGSKTRFIAHLKGEELGEVILQVPGKHNVLNALGALGAVLHLGISFPEAQRALRDFQGVKRRFQILGEAAGILVVDDYAHNPTKIRATLAAAKAGWHRRLIAVFQPHRYTRTKFLLKEFVGAFQDADILLVCEIYSAGEAPIPGIEGGGLVEEIKKAHPEKTVHFLPTPKAIREKLLEISKSGDMVITLGAGDIYRTGNEFFNQLQLDIRNAS